MYGDSEQLQHIPEDTTWVTLNVSKALGMDNFMYMKIFKDQQKKMVKKRKEEEIDNMVVLKRLLL